MTRFEWFGGSVDLSELAGRIQEFFLNDGFHEIERYSNANTPQWQDVTAVKDGVLRTVAGCRKYYHVSIRGHPANFMVSVESGEWGKNLAAALLTCGIGFAGLAENAKFERELWRVVRKSAEELGGSSTVPVLPGSKSDGPTIFHGLLVRHKNRVLQQYGDVHRCTGDYKKDGGKTAV